MTVFMVRSLYDIVRAEDTVSVRMEDTSRLFRKSPHPLKVASITA